MLGAGGIAGLAGCLGNDDVSASSDSDSTDDDGNSTSSDSEPTDDDENSSPSPTTQPTGDRTAPVDLRMFPPNHNMDSFSSFSVEYESLILTTTGDEEVTIPVEQTVSLKSDSTATGVPVVENLAVPVGKYEIIEVHYSLDQTVTSDGQTAEIEFTSPESVNIASVFG
ncbi:hypothetical protein [Saliphagus sp. LR7]|uniref:hypothetical protein n=1 Tax=Saliphagus sp. LR7 TaxID=2282654 RepID=UPI00130027A3|nr:hypothetical protein [Saliphagus sp. LR7]